MAVAIYYVSVQHGDDDHTGESVSEAWATITKAVGEVAAGDTVYIGPGTYREKVLLVTDGSEGSPITWIPDPAGLHLTEDTPGIVRVTGCDSNEYPTSGATWDWGNCTYNVLGSSEGRIFIDGADYGVYGDASSVTINVVACGLDTAFYDGTNTDCIGIAGEFAFYLGTNSRCLAFAGDGGYFMGSCVNCVAIVGWDGFYEPDSAINCLTVGGENGFRGGAEIINCLALSAKQGFVNYSDTGRVLTNCRAIACFTGFYGQYTGGYSLDISTCSRVYCKNNHRAGGYTTENSLAAKTVLYDALPLLRVLLPILQFDISDGDDSVSAGDTDILGYPRRLGDGTIGIGAIEYSQSSLDFTTYRTNSPSVKLARAGQQKFVFWAPGGVEFTRRVWVKWSGYAGSNKPQLIVKGSYIPTQTDTATGSGTAWEELVVSATPSVDGEVSLYLYARDTDAAAATYFSDLR